MKFLIVAVALLAAQPALAKSWADESCSTGLVSENEKFTLVRDGSTDVHCTIAAWPTGSEAATLSCDDGSNLPLVLTGEGSIKVGDIAMKEVTEEGGVCD